MSNVSNANSSSPLFGQASVLAGQVRRYKTREELGIGEDIAWPNESYSHFIVVGQIGSKPVFVIQDFDGQSCRMIRSVDLENNTLIAGEA